MTDLQLKRLYWPAWNAAFKANWKRDRGSVVALREFDSGSVGGQVVGIATAAARREARGIAADDLRHACHQAAVGRDVSSSQLSNAELDRVLTLFRLLANPDDLDAVMDLQDPSRQARRRKEWYVANCGLPAAYVAKVALDKFGRSDVDGLRLDQLTDLVRTLQSRLRSRGARKPAPAAPAPPVGDQPF